MESRDQKQQAGNSSGRSKDALQSIKDSPPVQGVQDSAVVQKGVTPIRDFLKKFSNDWTMNIQAGALAYSLLVALFPILIAIISIVGLIFGGLGQQAKDTLIHTLTQALPGNSGLSSSISTVINNKQFSAASGITGIIALITAIFGGSRLFILMENCFDLIYHLQPRTVIKQNLMAIGMLLIFVVLTPIMVIASTIPAIATSFLQQSVLSHIPGGGLLPYVIGILVSLLITWLFFEAIYFIVPNQKISFRNSWRGALFAAILLQVYLFLFPLYATHFLNSYIGVVGLAIVFIVFLYYFALILLLGAQFNAFFAEGIRQTPGNLAFLVHERTTRKEKPDAEQKVEAPPGHKDDMAGNQPEGKDPTRD